MARAKPPPSPDNVLYVLRTYSTIQRGGRLYTMSHSTARCGGVRVARLPRTSRTNWSFGNWSSPAVVSSAFLPVPPTDLFRCQRVTLKAAGRCRRTSSAQLTMALYCQQSPWQKTGTNYLSSIDGRRSYRPSRRLTHNTGRGRGRDARWSPQTNGWTSAA